MNPASLAPNIPEITLDQLRPIPEPWQDVSLQGCLIEASAIARRIQDLARQIEQNADPEHLGGDFHSGWSSHLLKRSDSSPTVPVGMDNDRSVQLPRRHHLR